MFAKKGGTISLEATYGIRLHTEKRWFRHQLALRSVSAKCSYFRTVPVTFPDKLSRFTVHASFQKILCEKNSALFHLSPLNNVNDKRHSYKIIMLR